MKEKLNALVADEEKNKGEPSRANPILLLNAI